MLRDTSEYFIKKGHFVTLLARTNYRMDAIKAEYPDKEKNIFTISQDYTEPEKALNGIKMSIDTFGPVDIAILWIHTSGEEFSNLIKTFLFSHSPKTTIFQVWGSASVNPKSFTQKNWKEKYPNRYKEIFLGYKRKNGSVRWLTNSEISEGIIKAVQENDSESIIGR
ncbi:hypothetical protein SAMN05660903_02523 [Salegentibacter salinarum]|nr:hypothetical protein SAMN05660903_02523 [Salegentibacter salinarum]